MKKIKSVSLIILEKSELEKREMNNLSGGAPGECCICSYGSDNHNANKAGGLYSETLMGTFTEVRP